MEDARAKEKADVEANLRRKNELQGPIFEQMALVELKEREIEARVRAKVLLEQQEEQKHALNHASRGQLQEEHKEEHAWSLSSKMPYWSAAQRKAKAIARGAGAVSPVSGAASLPSNFIPFARSKGEDAPTFISLYLQVPGVCHVSEVKVELEDGVLYISRGILVPGASGVQKFTRSFPFEEDLLDTNRMTVTLFTANTTADGVSVLRFTLPKKNKKEEEMQKPTMTLPLNIPITLVEIDAAAEEEHNDLDDSRKSAYSTRSFTEQDDEVKLTKDFSEVSLDVPDDEVSEYCVAEPRAVIEHPDDEMTAADEKEESQQLHTSHKPADEAATKAEKKTPVTKVEDKDGVRSFSMQVPSGVSLEEISAVYDGEVVCVKIISSDDNDVGAASPIHHVFALTSEEAQVQKLKGQLDVSQGLLLLQVPLASEQDDKHKARRIRVFKYEVKDTSGVISIFADDYSVCSKGSVGSRPEQQQQPRGSPSRSVASNGSSKSSKKKKALKKISGLKSIATKYLKIQTKKDKSSGASVDSGKNAK